MKVFDVAIVGLGATGVGLLNEMQKEVFACRSAKPSVVVLNNKISFARGKAFGDAAPIHIVNTSPTMMSASSLEPDSFNKWLRNEHLEEVLWPTRIKFSKYLENIYFDIIRSEILLVHECQDDVMNLNFLDNAFELTLDSGDIVMAREVVMCLGAIKSNNFNDISQQKGFIRHHSEFVSSLESHVIIAGAGLTAVDAFLHVNKLNESKVSMFSRTGLAPTCLTKSSQYIPKYLSWNAILRENKRRPLQSFIKLLLAEHRALQDKSEFKPALRLMQAGKQAEYFNYLESRALNGDLPWQDVLISTRSWFPDFWRSMSIDERSFFIKKFGALWASWRHPIPMSSFSQLRDSVQKEQLRIYKSISNPEYHENSFRLFTEQGVLDSDIFWDATGGSDILENVENPLLKNLFMNEYIQPHSCGGIMIDPQTFSVIAKRKDIEGLYNIGPLNKGELFSTNAYWFNANCSERWAQQWVKRFTSKFEQLSKVSA
ncbi:FAD/NAD(P)-binding protein [Photobacterium sp. 2_MG-2023]|uniref:FAD/NAD(P)-binding protein n=1 Tax=Photobacterium sp. 2_MG-2023 TaxID=3062663 RepID=UPI0026E392CB|nr:FAD/NAD(P)-binding protein [Photobacterium sp. 2_MG-2023]MDO6580963.1 FAD/NAD(P)-binding protein [Photobacterium sp. 2_MG-2023]